MNHIQKKINYFIILLFIVAIIMIFLGVKNHFFLPPILTGLGFLIIVIMFYLLNLRNEK